MAGSNLDTFFGGNESEVNVKDIERKPDAASGAVPAAKPVRPIEDIRKVLADLPAGTKERTAWEQHGEGHLSREAFRDLWLEIRVPKKTPEPPQEGVKK
jgi:hypothetical protein